MLILFVSFLNGKSKKLFHYTDGIKGCGFKLEERLREVFFSILTQISDQLEITLAGSSVPRKKDSKGPLKQACLLVKAFDCKFMARDFCMLYGKLKVFKLLMSTRAGLNNKSNMFEQQQENTQERYTLHNDLMKTFQDVFMGIVGRISEDDAEFSENIPKMTEIELIKKTSAMDVKWSELLLGQAFNEIFSGFEKVISDRRKLMLHKDSLLQWKTQDMEAVAMENAGIEYKMIYSRTKKKKVKKRVKKKKTSKRPEAMP